MQRKRCAEQHLPFTFLPGSEGGPRAGGGATDRQEYRKAGPRKLSCAFLVGFISCKSLMRQMQFSQISGLDVQVMS